MTQRLARLIPLSMELSGLLSAQGLGIMRGERVLFRDVSLSVAPGEAVLLRGANGAGKTTLLRCLAGLAQPETGTCKAEAFHWIGHRAGVKPHESPRVHLRVWARTYGADLSQIDEALETMGLRLASDVPGAQLSAGQRRRTALARTLLARRKLWLLDEPFSALDTAGQTLLADMIAAHRADGGGVVAAVHGEVAVPGARVVAL